MGFAGINSKMLPYFEILIGNTKSPICDDNEMRKISFLDIILVQMQNIQHGIRLSSTTRMPMKKHKITHLHIKYPRILSLFLEMNMIHSLVLISRSHLFKMIRINLIIVILRMLLLFGSGLLQFNVG